MNECLSLTLLTMGNVTVSAIPSFSIIRITLSSKLAKGWQLAISQDITRVVNNCDWMFECIITE